jgi:hypothetical protein
MNEFQLSVTLACLLGMLVGAWVAWIAMATARRKQDFHVEKSQMWRIEGRAYRLVPSPGLDYVHEKKQS